MTTKQAIEARCWLCDSNGLSVAKESALPARLSSEAFAITDSHYGMTAQIDRCPKCGFLQCSTIPDVLEFYEGLEDTTYEAGRQQRSVQARQLVELVAKFRPSGRLLDIGAGSGMLVEQAIKVGFKAEGIEPSRWLASQAQKLDLPVHLGIFPHPEVTGPFDVITLVDVIEHVNNPVGLLADIRDALTKDGIALIVTPDVGSMAAKMLGWKWWHYRIAHIGYFDQKTLKLAFDRAGLKMMHLGRPSWHFSADYLIERVNKYLPKAVNMPVPRWTAKVEIPLNLRDSMFAVVGRA